MKFNKALTMLTLITLIFGGAAVAQKRKRMTNQRETTAGDAVLPPITYTEYKLANGLRVILHQDRTTPIVAVNIWYHVGSKNEVPGRTGFAHLFEHMMFQGSKHYDDDFFIPLQEAGGTLNGSTNADRTNYWEVVPANFLELALWLESDRMGYLLEAMTEAKLDNQRAVVKNEKRQNYDNRPYGLASARIAETMYPPHHPYHWLTIGSMDDLSAASMDDVKDFFRRFYVPNNASLAIAGDFDEQEARQLVEKYFGPLESGPKVEKVIVPRPQLEREMRATMEDRVQLPRVYMVWHAAPQWTADDAALDVLSGVLAGGKGSRLYKSLVYERQIAQDATAFHNSREIAGQFQIVSTAKPDRTIEEIEAALDEEIAKIKNAPPSAEEMERAYNAIEASFIYGLQTVGGFGGKSDQLNQYTVFLNKPNYFNEDLARYRRVTASDVQRVAKQYLTDKRLVLQVVPRPRGAEKSTAPAATSPVAAVTPTPRPSPASFTVTAQKSPDTVLVGAQAVTKAEAAATTPAGSAPPQAASGGYSTKPAAPMKEAPRGGLYDKPQPKPDPAFKLPALQRRRLSNGLEVLIVEHHELPIINLNLVLKTGAATDAREKLAGLASITIDMLDEGTRTRTALDVSNQLAAIGARLGSGAGFDSSAVNLSTLARHFDRALEIYADVLLNPSFPPAELERLRASRATTIMQRRDNANEIADIAYAALLYGPDHPYGRPLIGTASSLRAIKEADVRRFYETYYRPNNATLIVAGDITSDALIQKLEKNLAAWKQAPVPTLSITAPASRERATLYVADRPGSAQSVIAIGHVGVPRSTPDYFPLLVMNTMLGGQFTSRVNMNLREDKGYTYGARTSFNFRRAAGPFVATAGVQTAVTKEAVAEFLKELRGVRGEIPIKPEELEFAKQAIIRGFPRGFETPAQMADRLADLALYDLPDDYFNNYIARIRAVTLDDVRRVAAGHLDPARMVVLVVGDRQVIESPLRSLENLGATLTLVNQEIDSANPTIK